MSPDSATSPLLARARAVEAAIRERHGAATGWMARRSAALVTLGLGVLMALVFTRQLFHSGPSHALASVVLIALFVGTLYTIELGVGAIILAMLLSPEITLGSAGSRALALRLEDLMIPLVVLAWLGRKALGLDERRLRLDPALLLMVLMVSLQILVSYAGWGFYQRTNLLTSAFYILKQVEYFAIFFFTYQYIDSERKSRAVIALALVTAFILAIYNIFQIPGTVIWTKNRLSAPFEGATPEPSSLGGYFVLALALLAAFAFEAPTRRIRAGILVLFGLIFVPLLYTLSRTSYVAFLGMILVLALLKRSGRLFALIGSACALAPFVLPHSVLERIAYTFQDRIKMFGYFDRSFGERIAIWFKVYVRLKKNFFFGRGVTYDDVIDSYYARVLIETGMVGLVLFLALCGRMLLIAARVRRGHPAWWARAFALGYSAGLVALLIHAFSAITFVIVRIMEPFWLLSGIVAALATQLPAEQAASPEPVPTPSPPLSRRQPAHG